MIEEQNKNIEFEIRKHEQLGEMTEKEKEAMRQNLKQEIDGMQNQMGEKER